MTNEQDRAINKPIMITLKESQETRFVCFYFLSLPNDAGKNEENGHNPELMKCLESQVKTALCPLFMAHIHHHTLGTREQLHSGNGLGIILAFPG
jgi:hypothetical protein